MSLQGTRWLPTLRSCASRLMHEARLTLVRPVQPKKWVFVVGCYNSGTELLMNLLGTHPDISSLPVEGQFITDQFPKDYDLGLPRMWVLREDLFRLTEQDPGPDAERLRKQWLIRLDRSRPIFLEKSPPNAARTRWLQRHFPDAHFIALVRNGYAVAEGIRRKAEPHHLKDGWPLDVCARQWARSNAVLVEDAEHLERVCWVRYEDLASEPEAETARMLAFLGLTPQGVRLDGSFSVHERNDPIRDMNGESIARLTAAERAVVTREAEPMLRHFGYDVL